ncbi:hypothetical protein ACNO5E_13435 [Vibrio parahaemolyticus]|uniref:hypothetical protein n=1 Tax=Vibrio parahaemolyticus TaxID=670 RepID=UPI000813B69F|nr:hypothetical protein [Vibrio parahaemolyticus]OCP68239.1 hypothetical protein AKH08_15595 [Vibrio parahaemolyticus]
MMTPNISDKDGFTILSDVEEINSPERGCLEVVVQRNIGTATRYFRCEGQTLSDMYKQAITNPVVIMYGIV